MAAAGGVAGARDRVAELAVRILRILLERPVRQPLLIAQLHAAQVQHRILHGDRHALPAAALLPVQQRGENAGHEVNAGARVANLGAGDERHAVHLSGR